jgi:GNAT superfamily N-acetyltransferase
VKGDVGTGDACPPGYAIRLRDPEDDLHLVAAENAASALFADHGYPQLADDGFPDVASFRAMIGDGEVFVAIDACANPVGYAVAVPLGEYSHLRELAVHPDHGRRGVGRALVGKVVDAAQTAGRDGVSLTTFRDVPFNQPFYEMLGFRELPVAEAANGLAHAFRREVPAGIDPARRILMIRRFEV